MTILATQKLAFPWPCEDPFLFCAYHLDQFPRGDGKLAPVASLKGRDMGQDFAGKDGWNMYHGERVPGFPQHPHRGFETVTVVLKGLIDHSDSLGGAARYGQGDAQWLTTGAGISHSEMFPLVNTEAANPTEAFQIWLNLPSASKMAKPHFSILWAKSQPQINPQPGVKVRLVAGAWGTAVPPSPPPDSWAKDPAHGVAIWIIEIAPGAVLTLPAGSAGLNRNLYYFDGQGLKIGGQSVEASTRLKVPSDQPQEITNGPQTSRLLLLQGRPIGERVVQHGPFVANSEDGIVKAFEDYRTTGFGGWPWPTDDPLHPTEQGRFARHPDGKEEKPNTGD